MTLDPYFTALSKINFQWIKDLSLRSEAVQLLEENREKLKT
jgi:hypothetical protein